MTGLQLQFHDEPTLMPVFDVGKTALQVRDDVLDGRDSYLFRNVQHPFLFRSEISVQVVLTSALVDDEKGPKEVEQRVDLVLFGREPVSEFLALLDPTYTARPGRCVSSDRFFECDSLSSRRQDLTFYRPSDVFVAEFVLRIGQIFARQGCQLLVFSCSGTVDDFRRAPSVVQTRDRIVDEVVVRGRPDVIVKFRDAVVPPGRTNCVPHTKRPAAIVTTENEVAL